MACGGPLPRVRGGWRGGAPTKDRAECPSDGAAAAESGARDRSELLRLQRDILLHVGLLQCRALALREEITVNAFIDEGNGPNPGLSLAHNAFWAEATGNDTLLFYFMTESDNQADLLVYEATPWINR